MVKLLFKESRISIIIWFSGLVFISVANVLAIANMFNTDLLWREYVQTVKTPFGVIFAGPGIGLDINQINIGGAIIGKTFVILCIAIAVMNVNYIVNWNRKFEEDGRSELLLSLPVNRFSLQRASIINLTVFNILVSIAVSVFFLVSKLAVFDTLVLFSGFFLYCEMWMFIGLLCSAIFSVSRSAKFCANGILLLTYIVGALGWVSAVTSNTSEMFPNFPVFCQLSPIHWLMEIKPFVQLSLTPLIPLFVLTLFLAFLNHLVYLTRDMNDSFIKARVGKKNASKFLNSIFGLRFKQVRLVILVWSICIAALGGIYGSMIEQVSSMISSSEIVQQIIKVTPQNAGDVILDMSDQVVNGFLGYIMLFLMFLVAAFQISLVNSVLTRDEVSGSYEMLFAKPFSRVSYLFQSVIIMIISLIFASGLSVVTFSFAAYKSLKSIDMSQLMFAGLIFSIIPLFFLCLTVFLHSINKKLIGMAWGYFGVSIVITMFADVLKTPQWLNNLAITNHFGNYPVDLNGEFKTVFVVCLGICVTSLIASFICYKNRDI